MGAIYNRRFLFDPGLDVLLNIESFNVLDLEPPESIVGIGTGTVLVVGEFENGPFNVPTQVASTTDLTTNFGTLGYTYNNVPAQNPCCRQRSADGALTAETWNGNAIVQMNGKKFASVILVRADTSIGQVQFTRLAYITGAAAFRYVLAPSQVLALDLGSGPTSATFTATAATVTSGAQTISTTFAGGETVTLGYDQAPNFTTTFLSSDQSQAAVIARINQYAGFAFVASVTGTTMSLTGLQKGNQAQVRVVSGSSGVLTILGLTAAVTLGTGNVANIAAVSAAEINTVVTGAVSNTKVEQDSAGALRISNTTNTGPTSGSITVGPATTATALGFAVGQQGTALGFATLTSTSGTYATSFAGGETLTLGYDGVPNFTVTFASGDQSLVQVIAKINLTAGFTFASTPTGTKLQFTGLANGGQVRVVAASAAGVLTTLGLVTGTQVGAAVPNGILPAGTMVQTSAGVQVVTMQDVNVLALAVPNMAASGIGPYPVKVRHALDDGTGLSITGGALTVVTNAPDLGAYSVVNLQACTACLTDAQVDAAYTTAIASTLNLNSIAKTANIIVSARQSNTVRRQLKVNALAASAGGCNGRIACIRPPLNTAKSTATSTIAEPGVGAYRDQRVVYCYIGSNTTVPLIQRRGASGGTGFTANGAVDVGSDVLLASVMSQLPPEENPGQETTFTASVNSIELGANVQAFMMQDYIDFKAAGICALRVDDQGVAIFQSGVTSVDPLASPSLTRISRRRMADFVQDSMGAAAGGFGKRLSTNARRVAWRNEVRQFGDTLLGKTAPGSQRIGGYTLTDKVNSTNGIQRGAYRLRFEVQTLASLDSLIVESVVGETVNVTEVLPQGS